MGSWDIQHDRDAAGRSTRQTLVPSPKQINAEMRDALTWLVRLKDERPTDYEQQKPLAWAAARAALAKAMEVA